MPAYRFYTIKHDGHIAGPPTDQDLPNDDAALKEAKRMVNGNDIEVWEAARIVGYLTPDEK